MKFFHVCTALMFSCFMSISAIAANVVKNVTTGTEYETFAAAISDAESGARLELIADAELTANLTISGKKLEFSGGKYALKGNAKSIFLADNTELTIKDGVFLATRIQVDKASGSASKLFIEDGSYTYFDMWTYGKGRTKVTGGIFRYSLTDEASLFGATPQPRGTMCFSEGQAEFLGGKFTDFKFLVSNHSCKITMGGEAPNPLICERCEFKSQSSWSDHTGPNLKPKFEINQGTYKSCFLYVDHDGCVGSTYHPSINVNGGIFFDTYFQAGVTEAPSVANATSAGYSTINILGGNFTKCAFSASKLGDKESNQYVKQSVVKIDVSGGNYEQCSYGIYGDNAFVTVNREMVPTFPNYTEEEIAKPFLVGETSYETLTAAYNASNEGDVIKMRAYYVQNESLVLTTKNLRLDACGNIFYGGRRPNKSYTMTSSKKGSSLIISGGYILNLSLYTNPKEGRLTTDEISFFQEKPLIVLKDGFYLRALVHNNWSGSAKMESGWYLYSEFVDYNFTCILMFGGEGLNPVLNHSTITVAVGHGASGDKYWGDAFAQLYSGFYIDCKIGVWTYANQKHKPRIDIFGGRYIDCNIKCLKYYNKAEQKPSMRIYNGEFLSCEITESGLHEDSLWTGSDWGKTFEGKYDSDLVICGGRFSDNPTATIDPKSKVYYNSNSGVLYKYRVFEPNLFMIKIR